MSLVIDPDGLTYQLGTSPVGANLTVDVASKLIYLRVGGSLGADGLTLRCLYSKLIEIWAANATAVKYAFPITPITDEQMEFVDWKPADDTTRNLLRTGGWAEKTGAVTNREYAGIITLGSIGAGGQIYYLQNGTIVNAIATGPMNQGVQVYGDASNGNMDHRSYIKLFIRQQAKTYSSALLTDIGVSVMSYQVYRFPLSNADDLKVTQADVVVDAYGVTVTWYTSPVAVSIGGVGHNFHVEIDGGGHTAEEIYMAVQSMHRKADDMDAGAGVKNGLATNRLLDFYGDKLICNMDSAGGVYIKNFASVDINRIEFVDDLGAACAYPYISALALNFNDVLRDDPDAIYRVYFTNDDAGDNLGYDFGTANAITVLDGNGDPMSGQISGQQSIVMLFDYDGNVQRGTASAGHDAPVTVVAVGKSSGQYVRTTGVIMKSTSNAIAVNGLVENNYTGA